jgi:hypothetical protein
VHQVGDDATKGGNRYPPTDGLPHDMPRRAEGEKEQKTTLKGYRHKKQASFAGGGVELVNWS